jgi:hypothetical protein
MLLVAGDTTGEALMLTHQQRTSIGWQLVGWRIGI